jgi:hypothetical protein
VAGTSDYTCQRFLGLLSRQADLPVEFFDVRLAESNYCRCEVSGRVVGGCGKGVGGLLSRGSKRGGLQEGNSVSTQDETTVAFPSGSLNTSHTLDLTQIL